MKVNEDKWREMKVDVVKRGEMKLKEGKWRWIMLNKVK